MQKRAVLEVERNRTREAVLREIHGGDVRQLCAHVVRARRHELLEEPNGRQLAVAAWASSRPGEGEGARIPFRNPHPMGCGELYDGKLSLHILKGLQGLVFSPVFTKIIFRERNSLIKPLSSSCL